MIPKKVTWVQFPARISTVYSKPLPINDLVFQFLIKHWHICYYKFLYRISDQEISNQELCTAMLHKLCNFSPIFSFLYADLAIPEKCHLKLYLQSFKQWILELSNLYLISQVNPIWTYFRNRLVPSDICFST